MDSKKTKYIKVEWPEYQKYMKHLDFYKLSGFDVNKGAYYIPESLIEKYDRST